MPISPPLPGLDPAAGHPGRSGLRLDYHAADRGPVFRRVLQESAVEPASTPAVVHEGADALSQLRRDLMSGAAIVAEAAAENPAEPVPEAPSAIEPPGTGPARRVAWNHDAIEGRRLGDHPAATGGGGDLGTWLFGEDGFGFDDLIDVVNPLQHIPVVSSLYRWITGDEIAPGASIAGGALFGGPIGLAGSVAGVVLEEATGRDLGGHALAMMFGDETSGAAQTPEPPSATGLAAAFGGTPAPSPRVPPGPAQLAGAEAAPPPVALIPAAMPSADAPNVPASPAASPAAAPTPSATEIAIGAQMKLALDKYEALMRQRAATPPGGMAGGLHDHRL